MNITPELLTTWVVMAVGAIGAWFAHKFKVERLEEKDTEQARQIASLWKWKDTHDRESNEWRNGFNKEISKLEGANLVVNEQFKQIMAILEEIKVRIGQLEANR